jgi:hypothetical protein
MIDLRTRVRGAHAGGMQTERESRNG